jgi:PAS domain S-box-containing protein
VPRSSGHAPEVLWKDEEFVLAREVWDGEPSPLLAVTPASAEPSPGTLARLQHAYTLREELDPAWAARPLRLDLHRGRLTLLVADPGGEPLSRLLGQPWEIAPFLRVAIGLACALGQLHERGLIHKDINPANILVNAATYAVWLTGFGIASRLPRERQVPAPPEVIAGTLAYMAPEQTGRMNRSVDARSDLYSLGVTLYETLTGGLPFTASDPMEWVHCHIARRPTPPEERVALIQRPLSAIVMKLLAKTADDRYQTAAGLAADLRRCLADWELHSCIEPFPLGADDASNRLLIPEKLYGRQHEIETLLAAFDRVVANGATQLVLVSGYSGIGKSTVVNELHKALVASPGLFASGKFDQYKRDVPYATLAQAFQSLIRTLLGKSEAQLGRWRHALREALGPNGQLIVNLVPELELVIGKQPPVPDLPPQDGQSRFQIVFRRFINVFARPEHPLALFLDDLQWLDAATLDLLKHLIMHSEVRNLFLVGAYRDNEVDSLHPLLQTLEAMREAGAQLHEIVLTPLGLDDVCELVADALHCELERVRPLAQLVQEKTLGNPFFAIQFFTALAEEGLVAFDADAAAWRWDIERIRAKGYTDNLADLMAAKLNGLPSTTLEILKQLACLGNGAQTATMSMVFGMSEEALHAALWPVVWAGLVFHLEGAYSFLHDRVQEAAYALIPAGERPALHLRIGRELVSRTPAAELEEDIFEIVSQLNRGADLIDSLDERESVAELNLVAGRRARASAAHSSALTYLSAGRALLAATTWERKYRLIFDLEFDQARCEILTGALATAEARLATLSRRSENVADNAAVACLRADLYTNLDQPKRAIEVGLECLRFVGIKSSMHPTDDEVNEEYAGIWRQLGSRSVEGLLELPSMTDPNSRAAVDVLTSLQAPAHFVDRNLVSLIIGRMANLSLAHGNTDGSCFGYVYLGMILQTRFGDYRRGLRFGKLGIDLLEKNGLNRFRARVYNNFAMAINPWGNHVRTSIDLLRLANRTARETGDVTFMGFSYTNLISARLIAGDPLSEVQKETEVALAYVQRARFGTAVDMVLAQLGLIRALRGVTSNISTFDHAEFIESQFERHLEEDPGLAMPACWYWIRKIQVCYLAGAHKSAVAAAIKAEELLWTSPGFIVIADYHFYAALARLAQYGDAAANQRGSLATMIEAHRQVLRDWAESCPQNWANRAALVAAEVARVEGRLLDAMDLYEEAIRSANENGFVNNEALANELAAQFYEARGFETISNAYLGNARYCYLRWGADGKVRQLDRFHPHLAAADGHRPVATNGSAIQQLDVGSVVKASQALSSEIALPKLIERLMTIAIENAGADRGLLIFPAEDSLADAEARIEAEARTDGEAVVVRQREAPLAGAALPKSIVHYVARTRESVILDDTSAQNPFSGDAYIDQHRARSILCLPLIKQGALVGVLYLENNLASHVFTPARVALLELLASQAAISLESTRLYTELEEREAKIRRLVDANIIGIFIWNFEGEILEANDAFLQMVGYRREDLSAGPMRWTDLTPPEWRDSDQRAVAALTATGTNQPGEKEYYRKDGSRAPVLVGSATFGGRRDEGVAFVVDLTERKRAEAQARETERRYREVQLELEHANRVETVGQLSLSIAHEVNQPIGAAIMNADTALRWLDARPLNLEKVRQALGRILENGKRAGEVIEGMRALIKKEPPRRDRLTMNEMILEIVALTRGETLKNEVSVRTQLANGLPVIEGDKVQLQQVILNLIINAIQAMTGVDEGLRELLISTEEAVSEGVLVAVADSGPGLAPAAFERLFEAFYTTKPSGLGMGLAISRSIIEAHGGRLWATENVPHGAVFQFTVPIWPEAN